MRWIQKAIKHPGELRMKAGRAGALKDGISLDWLKSERSRLHRLSETRGLSQAERHTLRQINLALKLRKL